ncbi:MAG: F0F1 ATP synthase subunit B [Pseudomonadota bacterium]
MLIDWFTVGAQVLNFLILVWLLKRFLYHPILDAIDAREQRIAAELAAADARKAEAGEERAAFEEKNAAFDKERANLLTQATVAANTERQRLLDDAREAATALSAKRQESLQTEARELQQEISRRAQQEVFAIARKALGDLADAALEERMVAAFVGRLQALADDEKQKLASSLKTAAVPLVVRSSFDLPAAQQATIKASVHDLLATDVDLVFETAPDLVSGIELCTDGQKLAWSIAEYLKALEGSVAELLKTKAATH